MRDWVELKYSVCFYRITVQYNSVAHLCFFIGGLWYGGRYVIHTQYCRIIPLQGFTFQSIKICR